MPHLLVAISSHGFGHAAQTAPVVNALRARLPSLQVTLQTTLPPAFISRRFNEPFAFIARAADFGMRMHSAIDIDVQESARAYRELHARWEQQVAQEAAVLRDCAPDLILANVPYLTLAAAKRLGIPAIALCSLNWADIYAHYCGDQPQAPTVLTQIRAAYASAEAFLQPVPHMPMLDLARRRSIGPIATIGADRRSAIRAHLRLQATQRLVLISPGGMEFRLPIEHWPRYRDMRFVIPDSWDAHRDDLIPFAALNMSFPDVLRSVDALIAKPGYGSFAEAAVNGAPVLYVRRPDWPEEPYLIDWLKHYTACAEIPRDALMRGEVRAPLEALWSGYRPTTLEPSGIAEAANFLSARL